MYDFQDDEDPQLEADWHRSHIAAMILAALALTAGAVLLTGLSW